MKYGIWNISTYEKEYLNDLQQAGFSPLTARVLCSRGLNTPPLAREF